MKNPLKLPKLNLEISPLSTEFLLKNMHHLVDYAEDKELIYIRHIKSVLQSAIDDAGASPFCQEILWNSVEEELAPKNRSGGYL